MENTPHRNSPHFFLANTNKTKDGIQTNMGKHSEHFGDFEYHAVETVKTVRLRDILKHIFKYLALHRT